MSCSLLTGYRVSSEAGRPVFVLEPDAAEVAAKAGVGRLHLTLSHEKDSAFAVAVAEGLSTTG